MAVGYEEGFLDHKAVRSVRQRLGPLYNRSAKEFGFEINFYLTGKMDKDLKQVNYYIRMAYVELHADIEIGLSQKGFSRKNFNSAHHSGIMRFIMDLRRTAKYIENEYPSQTPDSKC
jgi:hypothetical protein